MWLYQAHLTNPNYATESLTVAVLMETLNGYNVTAEDRMFGFRQSALYGHSHKPLTALTVNGNRIFLSCIGFFVFYNKGINFFEVTRLERTFITI